MKRSDLTDIITNHSAYWDNRNSEMKAYSDVYKGEMFGKKHSKQGDYITIETSDAFAWIESTIASLFPKAPAVVVGPDAKKRGDAPVAEAVINQFLFRISSEIEAAMRYALVFPCAFFKLGLEERESSLDSISIKAVKPWDIILDMDAEKWDDQRYVGHRYYLPFAKAKEKFGRKKWEASFKLDYLAAGKKKKSYDSATGDGKSETLQYIEIFEMYDFLEDELIFYSPNLETNDGIIQKSPIIFQSSSGISLAPIIPMYMAYDVHVPLKGMSNIGRLYDQLFEINNIRTIWANGIRRDVRMYLARKGVLDDEGKAILSENRDMSVVELDLPPDQVPNTALAPMHKIPYSGDHSIYKAEIRADLDRGSVMAPFTRGQATNATATEISAMAEYTASEIGKLAKGRDEALRLVSEAFLSLLVHLLDTLPKGAEKEVVLINKKPIVLVPEHFKAKFRIVASEGAATPISGAIKKRELVELTPLLVKLGVSPETILKELVLAYNLPESFAEIEAAPAAPPQQVGALPSPRAEGAGQIPVGGGAVAHQIRQGVMPGEEN
jgi:hypothetical protein